MLRKIIVGFGIVLLLTASALAFPVGFWLWNNVPYYLDGLDSEVATARSDFKQLEQALAAYREKRGHFPESLIPLTDDRPILPEGTPLVDPWGNPYIYEPHNLHGKTGLPLISTNGGPGRKKPITNWD